MLWDPESTSFGAFRDSVYVSPIKFEGVVEESWEGMNRNQMGGSQ